MPSYVCPTCGDGPHKWSRLLSHWQKSGHKRVLQEAALAWGSPQSSSCKGKGKTGGKACGSPQSSSCKGKGKTGGKGKLDSQIMNFINNRGGRCSCVALSKVLSWGKSGTTTYGINLKDYIRSHTAFNVVGSDIVLSVGIAEEDERDAVGSQVVSGREKGSQAEIASHNRGSKSDSSDPHQAIPSHSIPSSSNPSNAIPSHTIPYYTNTSHPIPLNPIPSQPTVGTPGVIQLPTCASPSLALSAVLPPPSVPVGASQSQVPAPATQAHVASSAAVGTHIAQQNAQLAEKKALDAEEAEEALVDAFRTCGTSLKRTTLQKDLNWHQRFKTLGKLNKFLVDRPHMFKLDRNRVTLLAHSTQMPVLQQPSQSAVNNPQNQAFSPSQHQMELPSGDYAQVSFIADPSSAREAAARLERVACETFVTLDAEGLDGGLCLLQVAYDAGSGLECCLFDAVALAGDLHEILGNFLQCPQKLKFIHDLRMDAEALYKHFDICLNGAIDTQLAHELATGIVWGGLGTILEWCGVAAHTKKTEVHGMMNRDADLWRRRPLSQTLLSYAVQDVCLLHAAIPRLRQWLEALPASGHGPDRNGMDLLFRASSVRAKQACSLGRRRSIAFDPRFSHRLCSRELLEEIVGTQQVHMQSTSLEVQDDVRTLLNLVPERYRDNLGPGNLLRRIPPLLELRDVVFDLGARPRAFFGNRKLVFLCDDPCVTVTQADLDYALEKLEGKFGPDNRAGVDGSLHRISAMRSKTGEVYGLTLRVGRAVYGNTNMITDLLLSSDCCSVLVLGSPGCGKTTIVREAARVLSMEAYSVVVVDTSNEICGDAMILHKSVGMSRRMVVPDIGLQASVLIEAVQNHCPDVIVVDEIGRRAEVDAARTVKQRGVRLIGTAHGSLPGLVRNGMLNGLVGGVESVTLGDVEAKRQQKQLLGNSPPSKIRSQRAGAPVFDVIVELAPGRFDEWRVVTNVGRAVDSILEGQPYHCQRRFRDAATGDVFVMLTTSDGTWESL